MVEQNVIVKNETGLHARPAASLVQFVKNFDGKVELIKDGKTANAKSIFNVMALGCLLYTSDAADDWAGV